MHPRRHQPHEITARNSGVSGAHRAKASNLGNDDGIYTLPHFCLFKLREFLKQRAEA